MSRKLLGEKALMNAEKQAVYKKRIRAAGRGIAGRSCRSCCRETGISPWTRFGYYRTIPYMKL